MTEYDFDNLQNSSKWVISRLGTTDEAIFIAMTTGGLPIAESYVNNTAHFPYIQGCW